jgi:hypothetical protein
MSIEEIEAVEAVRQALAALDRAADLCERVGYGSLVLGPLADAARDTRYALETVEPAAERTQPPRS